MIYFYFNMLAFNICQSTFFCRYEDFFGAKKKDLGRRKSKLTDGSESELSDSGDEEEDNKAHAEQVHIFLHDFNFLF